MKKQQNQQQRDTIRCDGCGAMLSQAINGHFLRSVLVLCPDCQSVTKWHVDKKRLDQITRDGVNTKPH